MRLPLLGPRHMHFRHQTTAGSLAASQIVPTSTGRRSLYTITSSNSSSGSLLTAEACHMLAPPLLLLASTIRRRPVAVHSTKQMPDSSFLKLAGPWLQSWTLLTTTFRGTSWLGSLSEREICAAPGCCLSVDNPEDA